MPSIYSETSAQLGAAGVYTGPARDIGDATSSSGGDFNVFGAVAISDQVGSYRIEGSNDATTWRRMSTDIQVLPNIPANVAVPIRFRYHRVVYTNGPTITGVGNFAINSSYLNFDDGFATPARQVLPAESATYVVNIPATASYATPTDMIAIFGSATKTIVITNILVGPQATAATLMTMFFTKRSTANTGGAPAPQTAIALDSANLPATATVNLYGSAPATGTAVGDVHQVMASASAATNAPTMFALHLGNSRDAPRQITDLRQPIVLRGVNEGLSVNLKGAALPAGFTTSIIIEWVEV